MLCGSKIFSNIELQISTGHHEDYVDNPAEDARRQAQSPLGNLEYANHGTDGEQQCQRCQWESSTLNRNGCGCKSGKAHPVGDDHGECLQHPRQSQTKENVENVRSDRIANGHISQASSLDDQIAGNQLGNACSSGQNGNARNSVRNAECVTYWKRCQ